MMNYDGRVSQINPFLPSLILVMPHRSNGDPSEDIITSLTESLMTETKAGE